MTKLAAAGVPPEQFKRMDARETAGLERAVNDHVDEARMFYARLAVIVGGGKPTF